MSLRSKLMRSTGISDVVHRLFNFEIPYGGTAAADDDDDDDDDSASLSSRGPAGSMISELNLFSTVANRLDSSSKVSSAVMSKISVCNIGTVLPSWAQQPAPTDIHWPPVVGRRRYRSASLGVLGSQRSDYENLLTSCCRLNRQQQRENVTRLTSPPRSRKPYVSIRSWFEEMRCCHWHTHIHMRLFSELSNDELVGLYLSSSCNSVKSDLWYIILLSTTHVCYKFALYAEHFVVLLRLSNCLFVLLVHPTDNVSINARGQSQ